MYILTLRICSKGFAKLAAGQVHRKYRPATPYWQKRLFDANEQPKPFAAVHIKNGYRADAPLAIYELRGIATGEFVISGYDDAPLAIYELRGIATQVEEHEGQPCYRIDLGAMIEIRP